MVTDALLHSIKEGENYGYSQSNNGITSIVIGKISKINAETRKVTLTDVKERRGAYGVGNNDIFEAYDRKRTVYGCILFPIGAIGF